MNALQRSRTASLPMLDQIAEQLRGPADNAFEKRKARLGEAPCDAAEEDRLGDGMTGGGEMADLGTTRPA